MSRLLIRGRKAISGTHRVPGNKNAALPMIAAALLSPEPVVINNLPDIDDVARMLDVARSFGVRVTRNVKAESARLESPRLRTARIDPALAAHIRTSFLFAGPLLARLGRVSLPPPGGDAIGHRRLDTHFAGFQAMGAKVSAGRKVLSLRGGYNKEKAEVQI